MRYGIYAVYDKKTGFMRPVFETSDGVAIRNFENAVLGDTSTIFHTHPVDFSLSRLGFWESETGDFEVDKEELKTVATILAMKG